MIDDVVEFAFAQGSEAASAIRVWVRPDGRFSRAAGSDGRHLTLGRVIELCDLTYDRRRDRCAIPGTQTVQRS
ncbi:hypothetical protein [Rhodococcus phenolicus]|uniref:hypothetical protein n=1 Tax=Rhodococcus phenolicus TaxID=263849 RepID=UPI0008299655|nr:hypothetical protein [Rhodococcus phenolicus]